VKESFDMDFHSTSTGMSASIRIKLQVGGSERVETLL